MTPYFESHFAAENGPAAAKARKNHDAIFEKCEEHLLRVAEEFPAFAHLMVWLRKIGLQQFITWHGLRSVATEFSYVCAVNVFRTSLIEGAVDAFFWKRQHRDTGDLRNSEKNLLDIGEALSNQKPPYFTLRTGRFFLSRPDSRGLLAEAPEISSNPNALFACFVVAGMLVESTQRLGPERERTAVFSSIPPWLVAKFSKTFAVAMEKGDTGMEDEIAASELSESQRVLVRTWALGRIKFSERQQGEGDR